MRHTCKTILALLLAVALASSAAAASRRRRPRAKYRFKIATIAPDGSAWVTAFNAMRDEILEATDGNVGFKAYPGGVLGEEKDVLYKIKVGQVQGGGFLGFGISRICPDSRAMMLPLLFESYEEVDAVFAKIRPYLEKQCRQNGYVALGWTEVGFSYLYSTEPVRNLADLRGAKPWAIAGDRIIEELFRAGKISGIPVSVGDVLIGLQTGLIKTVYSPPLAAVATQWFTRVKYRNSIRLTYSLGGVFVSEKAWHRIPANLRQPVLDITHRYMSELTRQVRASNEEALAVMAKNDIDVVTPSDAELDEYRAISARALARLRGDVFSEQAYDLVRKHLDAARAAAK